MPENVVNFMLLYRSRHGSLALLAAMESSPLAVTLVGNRGKIVTGSLPVMFFYGGRGGEAVKCVV